MKALYLKSIDALLKKQLQFVTDTINAILVDLDDYATAVEGATNATPIVVTATAHGFTDGDVVLLTGVGGNTAANGVFRIANKTDDTFELTDIATGANIAGNGAYTSGGHIVNLSIDEFLADLPAAGRVATVALAGKAVVNGAFDADDPTWSAVSGDECEAIVLVQDTGNEATDRLLMIVTDATGLPITPSGADITVGFSDGDDKIFRILPAP